MARTINLLMRMNCATSWYSFLVVSKTQNSPFLVCIQKCQNKMSLKRKLKEACFLNAPLSIVLQGSFTLLASKTIPNYLQTYFI